MIYYRRYHQRQCRCIVDSGRCGEQILLSDISPSLKSLNLITTKRNIQDKENKSLNC